MPFNTSASLIERGESGEESIESSEPTGETFRRDCVSLLEGRDQLKQRKNVQIPSNSIVYVKEQKRRSRGGADRE